MRYKIKVPMLLFGFPTCENRELFSEEKRYAEHNNMQAKLEKKRKINLVGEVKKMNVYFTESIFDLILYSVKHTLLTKKNEKAIQK